MDKRTRQFEYDSHSHTLECVSGDYEYKSTGSGKRPSLKMLKLLNTVSDNEPGFVCIFCRTRLNRSFGREGRWKVFGDTDLYCLHCIYMLEKILGKPFISNERRR